MLPFFAYKHQIYYTLQKIICFIPYSRNMISRPVIRRKNMPISVLLIFNISYNDFFYINYSKTGVIPQLMHDIQGGLLMVPTYWLCVKKICSGISFLYGLKLNNQNIIMQY